MSRLLDAPPPAAPPAPAVATGSTQVRSLRHRIVNTFEEIRPLRSQWDDLVLRSGGDIYSTFDWCDVWWRHYGHQRSLQIHLFYRQTALIGVVPLFLDRLCLGPLQLYLLRIVGCDHSVTTCGLTVRPEDCTQVVTALVNWIEARFPEAVLHLGPFGGYVSTADSLDAAFASWKHLRLTRDVHASQMVFDLPPSFDAYLASLPKKKRADLRREEREFAAAGGTCEVIQREDEVAPALDDFINLHQSYWQDEGRLGHFDDWSGSRAFHHELARRQFECGRLMLIALRKDGEMVAGEYCYAFGSRVHWILTARRRALSGRVGFCAMVREAVTRGAAQIDGMRGYYEYKKWLGARVVNQQAVAIAPRRAAVQMRYSLFCRAARALDFMYYRLWFSRIVPRFRLNRAPLWNSWIRTRL